MEEQSSLSPWLCALSAISSPPIFTPNQGRTPISKSDWDHVGREHAPLCRIASAKIPALLKSVAKLSTSSRAGFPLVGIHGCLAASSSTLPPHRWCLCHRDFALVFSPREQDCSCHSLSCCQAGPHHLRHPDWREAGPKTVGHWPMLSTILKWLLFPLHGLLDDGCMKVSVTDSSSSSSSFTASHTKVCFLERSDEWCLLIHAPCFSAQRASSHSREPVPCKRP